METRGWGWVRGLLASMEEGGGGEKKPEPDSPSLERKIWKSLGFKVHKSAKNSGEATRCRPYGEGKTALSVKSKKKGSVWAGIIERHSKQSAGHSGDTTAQRDPGGVPAFNTLGKNAPEDLEPLKRADKRSWDYGRSSGRVRSSENPATGQGPPLLSAPDHPYSHVARWCEFMPDRKRVHQTRNVNIAQQEGQNKRHQSVASWCSFFFPIIRDFVELIRFVSHFTDCDFD